MACLVAERFAALSRLGEAVLGLLRRPAVLDECVLAACLLHCQECSLRLTTYTTGKDKTTGKKYAYYACQTQRRHGVDACPAGPRLPAEATESEVLRYVEELLEDPREIVRRMDEAIESERATQDAYTRDSDATERALVEKLAELAGKREKLMELALDGAFSKDEIAKRAATLDEEAASVERLLQHARDAAGRIEKLQHTKRALVEAFETGLKLGIGWMPPQLRREVYEALGLRIVVDGAGGMHAEARMDTATIRFSQLVERYAYALRGADERLRREELKNPPTGYEVTLADPEGNPTTLGVTAHQERLERAERELAQVRWELSSSSVTAITSSEMSKLA
jgi:Recombinase zinc beta ribbon domain